jgi:hypothetical protein
MGKSALGRSIFAGRFFMERWEIAIIGAGAAGLMLMCLVSANFLCYLVIEVQPRYRLFIMPAVFALAAGYGHRKEKRV